MSQDDTEQPADGARAPRLSDKGQARMADRRARQAEALRANLRRRKDQLRAREDGAPEAPGAEKD